MKISILNLFFLILVLHSIAQSKLPITFKANEEADVWKGKEWDYSYTPLKNPINVEFDGKKLKMFFDTGKVYKETQVISYERKEKKNYDKLEKEAFILEIKERGFTQYLIIEKSYSYGSITTQIKIPFVTDTGEVMSYHYYQEF